MQWVSAIVEGRYRILEKVAERGTAEIFRALDVRLERVVALEVLRQAHREQPALTQSFEDEVRAMVRMTHPNVVRVYDYGRADGCDFMAMEYVRGHTLGAYPFGGVLASKTESGRLAGQLLAGLAAVRRAGITHPYVTPEDILVNEAGILKIAGFGIGQDIQAGAADEVGSRFSNSQSQVPVAASGQDLPSIGLMMCRLLSEPMLCELERQLEVSNLQKLYDGTLPMGLLLNPSEPRTGAIERNSGRKDEDGRAGGRNALDADEGGCRPSERVAPSGVSASDPTTALPVAHTGSPEADTIWFPALQRFSR